MNEYSQSQLVLTMKKSKKQLTSFPGIWKLFVIVSWIVLLGSFLLRNTAVPQSTVAPSSTLDDVDDVMEFVVISTPITSESITVAQVSHFTITSTISPSATLNSGTIIPHETSSHPDNQSTTATTLPPSNEPVTHYHEHTTLDDISMAAQPSQSEAAPDYGLIPVDNLFIFDWSVAHTANLKRTLDKVAGAIEALWNVCRTLYHYPLPPP